MFVVHSVMSHKEARELRALFGSWGILICDLPSEEDEIQRWLLGTFAAPTVLSTLRNRYLPILGVEKAHFAVVPEEDDDLALSRDEQIDRYGAERVCATASFKGSLMLALAANEVAVFGVKREDEGGVTAMELPTAPLVDQVIDELGAFGGQWVAADL